MFITQLFESPAIYVSTVVAFAASICIHEYNHAFVAHRLGDNTAKDSGYMTLNPLKVMGWLSIIALLLFGFSWGAVPVKRDNPSRWRRSAISLAGPLSNLVLLGIAALLLNWLCVFAPGSPPNRFVLYARIFLVCAVYANAILFLFNIVPVPPLDGWATIEPFLPNALIPTEKTKGKLFTIFIYLVCFSSATSGLFDKTIEFVARQFLPSQLESLGALNEGNRFFELQDYEKAYQAFEQAADQGNTEGALNLAVCLVEGYGCKQNPERAFVLFSKEDVCHYPLARCFLGVMRMYGIGCEQDYAKAYELLSHKDVFSAYPDARAQLARLLVEGWGVEQDITRAFELLNDQEILKVSPLARYYMAVLLEDGKVCKQDPIRAFSLMNDNDVLHAVPEAKFLLASWYYTGTGTKQNFSKAAQLLKEAADEGVDMAMQFLGYQDGEMPDYGMPLEDLLERRWNENE